MTEWVIFKNFVDDLGGENVLIRYGNEHENRFYGTIMLNQDIALFFLLRVIGISKNIG